MADLPEHVQNILTDLPTVRAISQRPQAQNPLLGLLLAQAQSLAEIEQWTRNCEALVQQAAVANAQPPAEAEIVDSQGAVRPVVPIDRKAAKGG